MSTREELQLEKAAAFERFNRLLPAQKIYFSSLCTNSTLRLCDSNTRKAWNRQKRHRNLHMTRTNNVLNMRPRTIDNLSKSVTKPGVVLRRR